MNPNREKTDKADEEAHKGGRAKYAAEEPSDVNVLGGRKAEESRNLIGDFHDQRVDGNPVEGEKVVVHELDTGSVVAWR